MSTPVAAMLFGPSLPGGGAPCTARFYGETLVIENTQPQRVSAQTLNARIGGANDDALLLDWRVGGSAYSLVIADKAAQQQLLAAAPASLEPQLRRWRGQAGRQRFKWNAVLATLGLLALSIALVMWQSERVESWLASKVSMETEQSLGESALKQLKASSKLTQEGSAAEAVKAIGERLTQGSRYHYQWYVKSDDSLNAFALPGGVVVVHTALLEKTQSAEELAGVLAHEVQHIELRHNLQQMIHSAGLAAILAVSLGDVSAVTAILLHQAGNMRHSRQLETQADMQGVQALLKAGISPAGMASFFKRMAEEMPDTVPLLSTHPAPAERMELIEQAVKQQPCKCAPLPYDWKAIKESLKG